MSVIDIPMGMFDRTEASRQLTRMIGTRDPLVVFTGTAGAGKAHIIERLIGDNCGMYLDLKSRARLRYSHLAEQITEQIKKMMQKNPGIGEHLENAGFNNSMDVKKSEMTKLLQSLNDWAASAKKQFVLAVDGSEEISKLRHIDFGTVLAYLFDNCRHITIVLISKNETLVRDAYKMGDPKAPLFGRAYHTVEMPVLTTEEVQEMVRKRVAQWRQMDADEEKSIYMIIKAMPKSLDTALLIVAELKEKPLDAGAARAFLKREAKKAHSEFAKFLSGRVAEDKYEKIISFLSEEGQTWTRIKEKLEMETGDPLYDKNFNSLLDRLEKNGYVTKDGRQYELAEPLLGLHYSS